MAHKHRFKNERAFGQYGPDTCIEICSCGYERLISSRSPRVKGLSEWMKRSELLAFLLERLKVEWPE